MVLGDTTFIIDMLRGKKEVKALIQNLEKTKEIIKIAAPTVMELWSGAQQSRKIKEIKKVLDIIPLFIVLPLDFESAREAGSIDAYLTRKGIKIDIEDIMIGAIAITNKEKLLTRNSRHFKRIEGLDIQEY